MGAHELLRQLIRDGLRLARAGGEQIRATPASALTDGHRQAIRAHRTALLRLLDEAPIPPTTAIVQVQGAARCCSECANFTRRKTCTEPVAAGLLTAAQGFGILWPDVGHAAQCAAFKAKLSTETKNPRFDPANESGESGNAIRLDDDE